MKTDVKDFLPADAIILTGDRNQTDLANLRQTTGPGYSLFINGKLAACGGVRITGIGEAWFLGDKEALKRYTKTIIKKSREQLDDWAREHQLCRMYAVSDISDKFLETLGFKKQNRIFAR